MSKGRKPAAVLDVFDYRRLREVRKEKGITGVEIEKNVTGSYAGIEAGKHIPSLTVFSELARYLDLDPFTIAVILRQPCFPPAKWLALRAAAKRMKKTLNDIIKEVLDAL